LAAYPRLDGHAPDDEKPADFAAVSNAVVSVPTLWTVATNPVTFACLASVNWVRALRAPESGQQAANSLPPCVVHDVDEPLAEIGQISRTDRVKPEIIWTSLDARVHVEHRSSFAIGGPT
jgi:hypothetical protein